MRRIIPVLAVLAVMVAMLAATAGAALADPLRNDHNCRGDQQSALGPIAVEGDIQGNRASTLGKSGEMGEFQKLLTDDLANCGTNRDSPR